MTAAEVDRLLIEYMDGPRDDEAYRGLVMALGYSDEEAEVLAAARAGRSRDGSGD